MVDHQVNEDLINTEEPVTYYAHIPKTGGTSFTALLDRFFRAEEIFPQNIWTKVSDIEATPALSYKLFRGHFGGGGVKLLSKGPYRHLTMLRNPSDLAQSTYQFVKRKEEIMAHELVNEKGMSFLDFLEHPVTKKLSSNRMVRFLSFDFDEDPSTHGVFLNEKTIVRLNHLINADMPTLSDIERLDRALIFLNHCSWIGILERFDDSLRLLCYQMNWPPIKQTQKLNVNKKTNQITCNERKVLVKNNQQDILLYESALKLFNQRYQDMCNDVECYKKSEFDDLDKLLDRRYQKTNRQKPSRQIEYGFDEVLKGSGWHRRQMINQDAGYCRWTGPEHFSTIDFWVEHQNYTLQLRINNAISSSVLDHLTLTVNGHVINWTTTDKNVARTISADVPVDLIKLNGLLRLGIEVNQVLAHKVVFDSNDERVVGINVHWINLLS